MNFTSIEQSKRLVELGLNPESADAFWNNFDESKDKRPIICLNYKYTPRKDVWGGIPCWSIGALLDVMPHKIIAKEGPTSWLEIVKYSDNYLIKYDIFGVDFDKVPCAKGITLLEAAYNMAVWLLENGYINKNK